MGASVAFFYDTKMLASYTPADVEGAPQEAEIAAILRDVFQDKKFKEGGRTDPFALQSGGRAIYSLTVGTASVANVGYAIARPRPLVTSPEQFFSEATSDDVNNLPFPALIGGAIGLALVGLLFIFLERDRPFASLRRKTDEIATGERDRLIITEWRGAYRKHADLINQAIDREVEKAAEMAPTSRKKANLDEILGPTPDAQSSGQFFGFAGEPAPAESNPDMLPPVPSEGGSADLPPPPPPAPQGAPPAPPRPPSPSPQGGGEGALMDEQVHFQEVFDQYIATRQQCGESIEGLTMEKFSVTLRKNRDQILAKHAAKGVRFSVQIKNGKAALKAVPIKK
jgi:hypothetical protein